MTEAYIVVLLICFGKDCYQDRIYSGAEHPTRHACLAEIPPLNLAASRIERPNERQRFDAGCMTRKEWGAVPVYRP